MNSKLESKLIEYEKDNPITNDEELCTAIEAIIKAEEARDADLCDCELIDEAVEALLALQDADTEDLEARAVSISDRYFDELKTQEASKGERIIKKSKPVKLRWLIPAAVILSIITASVITSSTYGFSFADMGKEVIHRLKRDVFHYSEGQEIILTNNSTDYSSVEDLREAVPDILIPVKFAEKCDIDSLRVSNYEIYKSISIHLMYDEKKQKIGIETPSTDGLQSELLETQIGRYMVHYTQYDGLHQAEFIYNGNYYNITATSYEILTEIIESLEEKNK